MISLALYGATHTHNWLFAEKWKQQIEISLDATFRNNEYAVWSIVIIVVDEWHHESL